MDDDKLSKQIQFELSEITRRKGYLLESTQSEDRASLEIIDEFLKHNQGNLQINKNLMSVLLLISNNLISDSVNQVFNELKLNTHDNIVLRLYLNLQMSSNFLDGFLLGHSFIKVLEGIDILKMEKLDILEIFKNIYLIHIRHKEPTLVSLIDEKTGLISHFENAYKDLFLSNSALLKDLARENIYTVVRYLMLTFFDGILTAKIISETSANDDEDGEGEMDEGTDIGLN